MNFVQRIKRKLFLPRETIEGYENPELVETLFLKAINYMPSGDWPLVAGIRTALDFGGGLACTTGRRASKPLTFDGRWLRPQQWCSAPRSLVLIV